MIALVVAVAFLGLIMCIVVLIDTDARKDIAEWIGRNRLTVAVVTVVVAVVCIPPLIGF